jgi:hypothetical protein
MAGSYADDLTLLEMHGPCSVVKLMVALVNKLGEARIMPTFIMGIFTQSLFDLAKRSRKSIWN